MNIEIETEVAQHILPLVRGLKLSRDLELAEQALHVEQEITRELHNGKTHKEPVPADA